MYKTLFVAWQEEATRTWHTIARLTQREGGYELVFTKGARRLGSVPEQLFRMEPRHRYRFEKLIPLFTNKLPPRSRPDFAKMANWLNLTGAENDFELLSKFGLIPGTDSLLVYPEPSIANGTYELEFFVHGIRHMHRDVLSWCDGLETAERVLPLFDVQNPVDTCAVALRSADDTILIGYVPTFYASDFKQLLSDPTICPDARITVVRNNKDAPLQLRLLCRFTAPVKRGFQPLDTDAHKPATELEPA